MGDSGHAGVAFLGEVGIVLAAALCGGLVARALRLPVLIGYLLAGVAVGPHTPGLVANESVVRSVADLGVALLMFAVGVQFSLEELRHVRQAALVGGGVQIGVTIALGTLIGVALGWGAYAGLFLGCALALSSTAVMLKILEERGEMGSPHGNILLGILVVQDLSLVGMIILLPSLAAFQSQGPGALVAVGAALLKALLYLAATLLMATRGAPALLQRIAATGSRELFLLTVVCLCLGAGFAADRLGLGLSLGAFLAGIVVSESGFAHEVFTQIRPLRDVFAAQFFVSVGMLLDPRFVAMHAPAVALVVFVILLGKPLATMIPLRLLGYSGKTLMRSGLGLAQIGEFSFVLVMVGATRSLVREDVAGIVLSAALASLFLTPFVYGAADTLYRLLARFRPVARWLDQPAVVEAPEPVPIDVRVLVLGAGRVGRYVSEALRSHGISHVVIDYDGVAAARLRQSGASVVYGDATSEMVLEKALSPRLELAVLALPEATTTEIALRSLKRRAPHLPVVARVHRGLDIPRMRTAGADAVVHAEFEAGTEMIRQGLGRLGITEHAVEVYVDQVRQHRYRQEE